MGRIVDINEIASQLLKQYRDIPSLDKSAKLLGSKYGSTQFAAIRKRFAQLWLRQNGIDVQCDKSQKKVCHSVEKTIKKSSSRTKSVIKSSSRKKSTVIGARNVPVPKIMQDIKGQKVVTKWVDPEENLQPVHVKLPVIRTMTFGGRLCYVVKYGPNGVTPYEWHVPVVERVFENLAEIPCIYHQHTLVFDSYASWLKVSKSVVKPASTVSKKTDVPIKQTAIREIKSKVSCKSEQLPLPMYRKTPEQWHAEVATYDKHKCGKPFVCSCCGGSFGKNQGYRIDYKEIYFCFECKKKIFKPSNKGWRGSVISIPMGNKR